MTLDGYTIILTPADVKQMFEHKPKNTGRMWNEYSTEHTFMTSTYDVYIHMCFYTYTVEYGKYNRNPALDTSWSEQFADVESVEFEILCGESGCYSLSEESVQEIQRQLNLLTF